MFRIRKAAAATLLLASLGLANSAQATSAQADPAQADPAPAANAYAAIRIVKVTASDPSTPQITLPAGYSFVTGANFRWASRGEYYTFVQGPHTAGGIDITVRWPNVAIHTVLAGESYPHLTRNAGGDPWAVGLRLPVTDPNTTSARGTVEVFSYVSGSTASGVYWRIEHNQSDRAAGYWSTVPWPAGEAAAAINYMFAAEAILQDSGLAAEARRRGHFFALMGFETNNLLHLDNPPHWHLSYYPGLTFGAPRAHVPHLWMDAQGRTFYNGMDIQGQGRSRFYAGDPAPIHDAEGNLIVTLTIRHDGGLDIDPPAGPRYSILGVDGRFDQVHVLRGGTPWRKVVSQDDVIGGTLTVTITGLQLKVEPLNDTTIYHYDALAGSILRVEKLPPPNA